MTAVFGASALAAALWLSAPVLAQTAGKVKTASVRSVVPRASDGKPDLTGVWQPASTIRGSWEEANAGLGLGGTGKDPSAPVALGSTNRTAGSEGAPYQPWAAKKVLEFYKKRGIDDPTARCLPPGVPRLTSFGLFPVQIVQTPRQVIVLYEYMNVFRVIPMNAKHPEDAVPTYLGDSVGRWEGDTLVVDITHFNDKTWLVGAGTFHSEALHVTERFTRVDRDRINYDVVMEDPKVLTKPWVYHSSMMLREGTRLGEYVCAENNEDVQRYEQLLKDGVQFQRP
ncbi:MAG: hypothetical protein LAP40_19185 [Acidobacteriia bacterium]|nr:hypothetical protein [Terriglobia bacterium]